MKALRSLLALASALAMALALTPAISLAEGIAADGYYEVASNTDLDEVEKAAASGTNLRFVEDYQLIKTLWLPKPIIVEGKNGSTVYVVGVTNRGFLIGTPMEQVTDEQRNPVVSEGGDYVFQDLSIVSEDALGLISIHAYEEEQFVDVLVSNCDLTNLKKTAIDLEGVAPSDAQTQHFHLTVQDSNIMAAGYGIGMGLDNNNPNSSACTVSVSDTTLKGAPNGGIYNIHLPNALQSVTVTRCEFLDANGGIKYVYTGENHVGVTDNRFDTTDGAWNFAILATNTCKDLSNIRAYAWATELARNVLKGQNVVIAAMAKPQVVWFPDGQAVNGVNWNNFGNANITDQGTRYVNSYGQTYAQLTDFNMETGVMTFATPNSAEQMTRYFYNTLASSGAYANNPNGVADYFTAANPAHCVPERIAGWLNANAVTRWAIGTDASHMALYSPDTNGKIIYEDDVAKVVVDTLTGEIKVTPKAVGQVYLSAYVGTDLTIGENGTVIPGAYLNYKMDDLVITVGEEIIPDPDPDPDPIPLGEPEEEIPLGAPATGGESSIPTAELMCAVGCALAAAALKKRKAEKN